MAHQTTLTLRTSIKSMALQKAIWQGTALGGSGVCLLLYSAVTYHPDTLYFWGLPIFFFGIGLIGWGFLPYRRLKKLEETPDKLSVDEEHNIRFIHAGHTHLTIPAKAIEKISYLEVSGDYGIVLVLKGGADTLIKIRKMPNKQKVTARLLEKNGRKAIFFPYFSERACQLLQNNVTLIEDKPEEEEVPPMSWDKFRV